MRSARDYKQAVDFLYNRLTSVVRRGVQTDEQKLRNIIELCEWQNNPQRDFLSIHVAGTNGKGSVCHMTASILQEAGYKTGLHTSPHLIDFKERTQINGRFIEEDFVVEMLNLLLSSGMMEKLRPSFFEISVWMAFMFFRKKKVEVAVIETGLGGRLDTTNILRPILSVITQIGIDHRDVLGDTAEKIAAEKAGIIKPQTPVVVEKYAPEYAHTIESKARAMEAPLRWASEEVSVKQKKYDVNESLYLLSYKNGDKPPLKIRCPLSGKYQEGNLATVALVADELNRIKSLSLAPISEERLLSGIRNVRKNTRFRARWECVCSSPMVIVDGAHNPPALLYAAEQAAWICEKEKRALSIVYGAMGDKDIDGCLAALPAHATYFFCRPNSPRGLPALELKKRATRHGRIGEAYDTSHAALQRALAERKEDIILVLGSLFLAGEALSFFKERTYVAAPYER